MFHRSIEKLQSIIGSSSITHGLKLFYASMKHKIALDEVIQVNGIRFRDEDRVKR